MTKINPRTFISPKKGKKKKPVPNQESFPTNLLLIYFL